jgi:hypothetical protein
MAYAVAGAAFASGGRREDAFFSLDELSSEVTLDGNGFYFPTPFGPTGLSGWALGDKLMVREVDTRSPADGLVRPGDAIVSVNGAPLGNDPLRTLESEVVASELTGTMALEIIRDGAKRTVTLTVRKLPPQSMDWPYGCPKSARILEDAARYLARVQRPDGGFDSNARSGWGMAGLVWLAADDPAFLGNCRRLIHWYHTTDQIDDPDNPCWGWGYFGTFLAEYFLRTGDVSALGPCRAVAKRLAEAQGYCGSWGHGPNPGHGYVQGGFLNAAGASDWLALELFDECGVREERALALTRKFFLRFVDTGTVPYGDHRPEYAGTGNSKDALACLALLAKGDVEAARMSARLCTDFPTARVKGHSGGFLGLVWGNVAGSHNPHRPDYLRTLRHWNWLLHVGRRWDGSFLLPHSVTNTQYMFQGPIFNTGGVALVFGVPNKHLRIFGAPRGVFGDVELPPDLERGLELYHKLDFDELRTAVSGESAMGRQLLEAARTRERDIALSLEAARKALEDGDPLKAKSIAASLDLMCEGRLPECGRIVRAADSPRFAAIRGAAAEFDRHRYLTFTNPESRRIIERLAASDDSGVYRGFARDTLATPADASSWTFTGSAVLRRFFDHKEDPLAMSAIRRLASMKGSNWTQWVTEDWLRKEGHTKDEFLETRRALVPVLDHDGVGPAPDWRYYAVRPTLWEGRKGLDPTPHPPPEWRGLDFDDR